jgi:hypothetical protein
MFLLLLLRGLADGRHRLRGASLLAAAAPSLLLRLAGLLLDVEEATLGRHGPWEERVGALAPS